MTITYGNDLTSCRFHLVDLGDAIQVSGTDDIGGVFSFTIDRLWAANLCLDLEQWLARRA